MPTYAYACTDCDHRFEVVQSFTDDSLTECPQCDGRLRKLFNAVGVVFKGGGFYRTDSRADTRQGSSARSASGGSGDGSGSGRADAAGDSGGSGSGSDSSASSTPTPAAATSSTAAD